MRKLLSRSKLQRYPQHDSLASPAFHARIYLRNQYRSEAQREPCLPGTNIAVTSFPSATQHRIEDYGPEAPPVQAANAPTNNAIVQLNLQQLHHDTPSAHDTPAASVPSLLAKTREARMQPDRSRAKPRVPRSPNARCQTISRTDVRSPLRTHPFIPHASARGCPSASRTALKANAKPQITDSPTPAIIHPTPLNSSPPAPDPTPPP